MLHINPLIIEPPSSPRELECRWIRSQPQRCCLFQANVNKISKILRRPESTKVNDGFGLHGEISSIQPLSSNASLKRQTYLAKSSHQSQGLSLASFRNAGSGQTYLIVRTGPYELEHVVLMAYYL